MANKILQANLNRARAAQALLEQYAAEHDYGIMVVSEPHWVPPRHSQWAAARGGSNVDVAITWRRSKSPLPCTFLEAGSGWVVVRWGDMVVIGVYLPPSLSHADFDSRLGQIDDDLGFPVHECEGRGSGGMGGVTGPALYERRLNEHLRQAAGGRVHRGLDVGKPPSSGQDKGLECAY